MPYTYRDLFTAVSSEDFNSVNQILKVQPSLSLHKIDVHNFSIDQDGEGNNILHLAVLKKNVQIVEAILIANKKIKYSSLLLSQRRNLFSNNQQQNPLHLLFTLPYTDNNADILEIFSHYDKVFFFMPNEKGETPAYFALKDAKYHRIILPVLTKSHRYFSYFLQYPSDRTESILNLLIDWIFSLTCERTDESIIMLIADAFKNLNEKKLSTEELATFNVAECNFIRQLLAPSSRSEKIIEIFCQRNLEWLQRLYNTLLQSSLASATMSLNFGNEHNAIIEVCTKITILVAEESQDLTLIHSLTEQLKMLEQALDQTLNQTLQLRKTCFTYPVITAQENILYINLKAILNNAALQLAELTHLAKIATPTSRPPMVNQWSNSLAGMKRPLGEAPDSPSKRMRY